MIKYISLDLQGTLSDSKFSDNFWLEIIPQKYSEKFNIDFNKKFEPQIEKFIKTGHLEQTENGYRLTIKGILISNLILSEFLL